MSIKERNNENKILEEEGLYVYGSGEMDQLSPIKEDEKYSEIYDSKIPLKIPIHFTTEKEKILKIKCGQMFTMLLSSLGNVYTFGCADNGGIGHEDSIPAQKLNLKFKPIDISGGDCHGLAYNETNLAFWGQFRNSQGGIGEPFLDIKYYDINDIKGEDFKKVISGTNHVIILSQEKNIFAFGNKEYGQRGINPKDEISHMQINKINEENIEDIFTGDEHSFLIKKDKSNNRIVKAWGLNSKGQLGIGKSALDGENYINISTPTKIEFEENLKIKNICGGSGNSICITEDNRVFIWGSNDDNLLGLNNNESIINKPKEIIFFNKNINPENEVNNIVCAYQSFYAINSENNKIYSWGSGDNYILGNKKEKAEKNPYLIESKFFKNMKVKELDMGCSHVAVLLINDDKKYEYINKNNNNKIKEDVIKARKRKSDKENEDENLIENEKEKFGQLKGFKIREEFITLNIKDKPKKINIK